MEPTVDVACMPSQLPLAPRAMASELALPLLNFDPLLACLLIGLTTMLCSWAGIFIGIRSGTMLESKAEIFGGAVLILIGLKILLP
ncbi:MAG: putative Mn2+ efflux pump MntP [Candidatus Paceibacteria bacterium]|jgi:putative Mn2+ efflux pump MntP